MIKIYPNITLLLLCIHSVHTMCGIKQIPNNLIERASLYSYALNQRFKKRDSLSLLFATKDTIVDFTSLIGLAIAQSNTCEKLIDKTSIDEPTKKIITQSVHNALRSNFALDILYLGKLPYTDIETQTKWGSSPKRFPDYNAQGTPRISPLLTSAGSIGIYVLTDVGLQIGATKVIKSVPSIDAVCKTINNNINIAPGTYSSLLSFGIAVLVRYWLSK